MTNPIQAIRAAVQALLDADEDCGWVCEQLVVCMGLERIVDGRVEAVPWVWAPPEQPDWQTTGLLHEAVGLLHDRSIETE